MASSLAPEDPEIAFNLAAVLEACKHQRPCLLLILLINRRLLLLTMKVGDWKNLSHSINVAKRMVSNGLKYISEMYASFRLFDMHCMKMV